MAPHAVEALSAIDSRVEGYPVARMKVRNSAAHGLDDTGGLVPHDDGWNTPARAAIESVHVASADSAGPDANQQLVRGGPRRGHIHQVELLVRR